MSEPTYEQLLDFVKRVAAKHRGCGDGWYACPWSEDYIREAGGDECWCFTGPARALLGIPDKPERDDS